MKVRLVESLDSKDIWKWRNDKLTRDMFIDNKYIYWINHSNWFQKAIKSNKILMYIGLLKDKKIGVVRFDLEKNSKSAIVSLNLNPIMRGKNLSNLLLLNSINEFRKIYNIKLFAKIKKINTPSIKCFTKVGFLFNKSDSEYNYYILLS